ncbi:MAG TPA: hydroxysqualene dehydroxylase HpnE [Nocardioides sp.]|jgi:squalene-associated FAD-dependent desaturase|uniref:hydroxysqualene dehydroxylase HpnE n=1 Tax=Nocardioides sp. TaxID=35761 RepID=UPI002E3789CA|nr:hydroxysqualene dehydroxylase HpnE [Nocardioides sp.]HEX3930869.1 hydroxysqualene dehydroxylase HpnE [Nocardioides sp.]
MRGESAARVAVVGGGLAGITTALGLADAGCRVTLVEARPRLGGLTHSFRRGDLWVDNGQHVFLRCCTSYLRLLERLGVSDQIELQPRLDVPVRSEARPGVGRLHRSGLPAPLHLSRSLLTYRWLSPTARVRAATAALALGRVDRGDRAADDTTFGAWLAEHGQGARAVEALWDLVGIATLNAPASEASLALAAMVFQIGLLGEASAADIGWSRVPLQQLHGDAAEAALREAGAEVRLGVRANSLEATADGWVIGTTHDTRTYDDVVVAASPVAAEALLPQGAVASGAGWAAALGSSPILNLHVVLDRRVLHEPFVAAVDSPLQWVFDRTSQSGLGPSGGGSGGGSGGRGQYLALSLSAADTLVGRSVAELRDWALPHLHRLLPESARAEVEEFFVTREPHATFRPAPGSALLRPPATTPLAGLHLAGAWTATGWPATMEGAVRSGEAAIASVSARTDLSGRPRLEVVS